MDRAGLKLPSTGGDAPAGPPKAAAAPQPISELLKKLETFGQPSVEPAKGKRHHVEGLDSGQRIKHGGSVTVYTGYSAITAEVAREEASATQVTPRQAQAQGVVGTEALPRQLPEGWEMRRSKSTSKVYYVNEKLGKTQWEPPAGSSLKAAPSAKRRKTSRGQDAPDAQATSMNGIVGLVRATEQKTSKWQKWQQCAKVIDEDDG